MSNGERDASETEPVALSVLPGALAALVIRKARTALMDGEMILGTSQSPSGNSGLTTEDRRVMALVSRVRLGNGLSDVGAEIHDLLAACRHPLAEWLPCQAVEDQGVGMVRLIDGATAVATPDADALAQDYSGMVASLEEALFGKLKTHLSELPRAQAARHYTTLREFVVRNPVVETTALDQLPQQTRLPSRLWQWLRDDVYTDIPYGWAQRGHVERCAHCGNVMQRGLVGSWVCGTAACQWVNAPQRGASQRVGELQRCHHSIHQYWVEPGFDETRLHDSLKALGLAVELYPDQDKVDVAFERTGIDLKSYQSPAMLGRAMANDLGGLAEYPIRWLVVPDSALVRLPNYLEIVRSWLATTSVEVFTLQQAISHARQDATT